MKYLITALIATSFLVFSCKNEVKNDSLQELSRQADEMKAVGNADYKSADKQEFIADSTSKPQAPRQGGEKNKQTAAQTTNPDWDKKIIKTGLLNLEVKDYNSFYTSIREKVKNLGGYVAQEEQTQSDYKIENTMTIKVPVDQFDNAIILLTANTEKINERKISSQDVTTEVVDTKSRMEAKKQVRQRYMDLLGQAKNMEDILSVQSEINNVQEQIESAAGRIEYLTHSSVFSTINLTYYQVLNSAAKEKNEEKNPSFGDKVKNGFKTGWGLVSDLFVALITIWPLLLGSFFVYLLFKKLRKSKPASPDKISQA